LLPINVTSTNGLEFVVNPQNLSLSPTYQSRDAIFWQTPLASDQSLGDVAEVGYFVQWIARTQGAQQTPNLCRYFVNAGISGASGTTANPSFLIYSNPGAWLSGSGAISTIAPANQVNGYQGLFAEDVLGLWVQCLNTNGSQITQDANGNSLATTHSYSFDSRVGYMDPSSSTVPRHLPAAVNLGFAMIDDRSEKKVTSSLMNSILALVTTSTNASSFVSAAQANSIYRPIVPGLRSYQTTILLQNSR